MTKKAVITQPELMRLATVAKATGCRMEVKYGEVTIAIFPNRGTEEQPKTGYVDGIDYSRPEF
ncbi:hypothetical protein [Rhizobium sp. GN54]|uniref:hypothetical protein n=1 Tax=Rhizobium sp. GN54 TaxID=2898150 RepID=UPI001E5329ED|nr:hypothetical protein [Rhizobium sp. GN54]MCD2184207.1 hypothetical protein [Rhizobium sp. GN54]